MVNSKGAHFQKDIILTCVRWQVAYPLSYRRLEEIIEEHAILVDHSTINRWVMKYPPQIGATFRNQKRPIQSIHSLPDPQVISCAATAIL